LIIEPLLSFFKLIQQFAIGIRTQDTAPPSKTTNITSAAESNVIYNTNESSTCTVNTKSEFSLYNNTINWVVLLLIQLFL